MQTAKALVIDDDKRNREILIHLLHRENVGCIEASTLAQLEAILDSNDHFDAIFLDLEMPDASGYDVISILRDSVGIATAPIIAYTVHLSEMKVVRDNGFDGFLGKPLDPDRFPDYLARILNGEKVWTAV